MAMPVATRPWTLDDLERLPDGNKYEVVGGALFVIPTGIADYWIVDAEARTVTVVRPGERDAACAESLTWRPADATEPLVVPVAEVFGD